jgi:hypothetical protein
MPGMWGRRWAIGIAFVALFSVVNVSMVGANAVHGKPIVIHPWQPAGPLSFARSETFSQTLADGEVLVAGGTCHYSGPCGEARRLQR